MKNFAQQCNFDKVEKAIVNINQVGIFSMCVSCPKDILTLVLLVDGYGFTVDEKHNIFLSPSDFTRLYQCWKKSLRTEKKFKKKSECKDYTSLHFLLRGPSLCTTNNVTLGEL